MHPFNTFRQTIAHLPADRRERLEREYEAGWVEAKNGKPSRKVFLAHQAAYDAGYAAGLDAAEAANARAEKNRGC